jgi:endoglucanase
MTRNRLAAAVFAGAIAVSTASLPGAAQPGAAQPGAAQPAPSPTFERGVIVAHWLGNLAPHYMGQSNVAHTYAAPWFDDEDLDWIAERGFDHLQIRAGATDWIGEGGGLREELLAPFTDIVAKARARRLNVVLAYGSDVDSKHAAAEWELLGRRFAAIGDELRFLVREEDSAPEVVAAIRRGDSRRFVYLGAPGIKEPGQARIDTWNATPAALERLEPARFDARVGLAFGYWEPEVFAFQHPSQPVRVPFPGVVPDMKELPEFFGYHDADFSRDYRAAAIAASGTALSAETVAADFARVAEWAARSAAGRSLYLSSFGMGFGREAGSSRRYIDAVASAAKRHGIGWAIYDYESGRAIRDGRGRPTPAYDGLGIAPPAKMPTPREAGMSFFVTSAGPGTGADLGGLAGADRRCQALATSVGVGNRTWRAYLSTVSVDARDRIGKGPWVNARGAVVAEDLAELHSERSRIDLRSSLTEKGEEVAARDHDVLTGSTADGRLMRIEGVPATCVDWTSSSADGIAWIGHQDRYQGPKGKRFNRWWASWNSTHETAGCSAEKLQETGSAGLFYCFAADSPKDRPNPIARPQSSASRRSPTFRRGVYVHHWLVMPLERVLGKSSVPHTYGARWFNGEDFRWLRRHGFDHVQIPVELGLWFTPDGVLDEEKLRPFEQALAWARSNDMGVVAMFARPPLPAGSPEGATIDYTDAATRVRVARLWRQLAERFASTGDELRFSWPAPGLRGGYTVATHRELARQILTAVRAADAKRFVYLEPTRRVSEFSMVAEPDASFEHLDDLELPSLSDDPRVGVAVLYSEPEIFTWQKGVAESTETALPPITFPGRLPDFAALGLTPEQHPAFADGGREITVADIQADFARVGNWMQGAGAGREVYLAHFGSRDLVDADSTRRYMRAVFLEAAKLRIGWSVYNYDTASGIRDEKGDPNPLYEGLGLIPEPLERPDATVGATASPVTFRRGVNIAHWLSHNVPVDYEYAAPWFDEEDVAWIASQGFDHLRLRVAGNQWIGADGNIDEAKIAPFDDVLRWAREHRLGVVLTMFSLPGYHTENAGEEQAPWPYRDEETLADARYTWWQVARRYAGEGPGLRFEILHRPDAPDAAEMSRFQRAMLSAIRTTNPTRVVYLSGHDMQRESLAGVPLAEFADPNLALTFEFFEPLGFTFQFDESKPLREFPGPGDFAAEAIDRKIDAVGAWAKQNAPGREIYVGAFGVYARASDDSARNFLTAARGAFERNGLSWAVYDYQSGCAVRGDDGKPTRNLLAVVPREVAVE